MHQDEFNAVLSNLYDCHLEAVLNAARSRFPTRREEAEDAVQNAMLKLLEMQNNDEKSDPPDSPESLRKLWFHISRFQQ